MFGMAPIVLRNLMRPKSTRRYPRQVRTPFDRIRADLDRNAEACTCCGVCAAKCPSECIVVKKKTALWQHDPSACVFCGTCVEVCPAGCLQHLSRHRAPYLAHAANVGATIKTAGKAGI